MRPNNKIEALPAGYAVAGFLFGIIALVAALPMGYVSIPVALLGIVFSVMGIRTNLWLSIAGLVLSIVGGAGGVLWVLVAAGAL